ncbi:hypothetical protein FKB34_11770 [Glycocaulis profundi]|nr:hypothetical protein FKB34_11770 [Glycocaulis profundi]
MAQLDRSGLAQSASADAVTDYITDMLASLAELAEKAHLDGYPPMLLAVKTMVEADRDAA